MSKPSPLFQRSRTKRHDLIRQWASVEASLDVWIAYLRSTVDTVNDAAALARALHVRDDLSYAAMRVYLNLSERASR